MQLTCLVSRFEMSTPLLKTVPSPWQSGLSCLCPQSQCLPFRSGCLSPLSIALIELPQEFSEAHKIAVYILVMACLVSHANLPMLRCMNIAMMVGTPVKVLSTSLHEICVPALQQLQMHQELQKAPSTNPGRLLPVPSEIGKATAVDSGCAWISCCLHWIHFFYHFFQGSSGTEFLHKHHRFSPTASLKRHQGHRLSDLTICVSPFLMGP